MKGSLRTAANLAELGQESEIFSHHSRSTEDRLENDIWLSETEIIKSEWRTSADTMRIMQDEEHA